MSEPKRPAGPARGTEGEVETTIDQKVRRPKLYKVILHNDDFTTMEFVVMVLMQVFGKSDAEATAIMLFVHTRGHGVAGVYTFEVAESKVKKVAEMAREAQYPLLTTMEPE